MIFAVHLHDSGMLAPIVCPCACMLKPWAVLGTACPAEVQLDKPSPAAISAM